MSANPTPTRPGRAAAIGKATAGPKGRHKGGIGGVATQASSTDWKQRYAAALAAYLREGKELQLQRAYELGRAALGEGRGVVELVMEHHQILLRDWTLRPPAEPRQALQRGGAFLSEAISAFEMTHRGFGDASAALRRMHEFVEKEAKRIAYALHDGAAQLLAVLHLKLEDLARSLPPAGRSRVRETRQVLDEIEVQLRALAHEIRPAALDDLGLTAALQTLVESFTQRTGIPVHCDFRQSQRWPPEIETTLYRIVQEALNNVRKHARARSVTVAVTGHPDAVFCAIQDDGVGCDPARLFQPGGDGLGLIGIRERVQALGGKLEVRSAPGQGTGIFVRINLEGRSWPLKS